jgi:hypothetical protein
MGVFELMGDESADVSMRKRAEQFDQAFVHYQAQRWADAKAILEALLKESPEDGPGITLLARVEAYAAHGPGPGWDGAYTAEHK